MTQSVLDETSLASEAAPAVSADSFVRQQALFGFVVGEATLAVDASCVVSVREIEPAVRIPHTPAHMLGFVIVADRALVAIDTALLLGLGGGGGRTRAATRLIVIRAAGMQAGFAVDRAIGVLSARTDALRPPTVAGAVLRPLLRAEVDVGERHLAVVNAERLLEHARCP